MKVGLVASDRYLDHETRDHPEQSERLRAIHARLTSSGLLDSLHRIDPRPATHAELLRTHSIDHLAKVDKTRGRSGFFDVDTQFSSDTADVAELAAGGAICAVDAVLSKECDRAMVMVRPPGHHATPTTPMGFCIYNNVAVAAHHAKINYGLKRIAIVDFDVHHGNGTQDIFYRSNAVFYFSIHQARIFPGSGLASERGAGPGEGTTLNVPLEAGTSPAEFRRKFEEALDEVYAFEPQLTFISAGFDAHRNDPLGGLSLESEDYYDLTRAIVERAAHPVVSVLEGGYQLESLAESVEYHLKALLAS